MPSGAPVESVRTPWALATVVAAVGLLFLGPLAYVVWRNLDLGTDLFSVIWDQQTLEPLMRSLWLAVAVALTSAAMGTGLAWLTVRTDLPGRTFWKFLAPLPLVFPSFVGATALLAGFAPGGLADELLSLVGVDALPNVRGFRGAWVVLTLFTYPYVYLPVAARFASLPPSLEESARLLGRSPWSVFRTVVFPQTAPAIWAGSLVVFLYAVSDFGAVALLGYDTLAEQVYADRLFNQPRAMGLALVLVLVAITVIAAERAYERRHRIEEASSWSSTPLMVPLGRWRLVAVGAVTLFLGLALFGPLAVFGFWAWRGLTATTETIGLATDVTVLIGPIWHSALAGLLTAVVAIVVLLPVAWALARYRSRSAGVANAMVAAGFALPGVVVALSLVFWVIDAPLLSRWYQTMPLLIAAYVLHFGTLASRVTRVAVEAVPEALGEAASTLGAGRIRRMFTVELPLMMPGLLAGGGLVLLSTLKELPITLLLAPIGFDTLATEIWGAGETGALAQGALASLVLVGLSAILTWVVVVRRIEEF